MAVRGRLHPVTTGCYLAAEPNGGDSASNWKERLRAACPLPTVTKNESCRSPGLRRMGKPTFVMSSVDFHLNFGCAAEGDINLHEMLNRYSLQSAPASNVAPI
jgi:hypothetical protein